MPIEKFSDVFHFAAIVGGRAKIDGDPIMVALDLAIDAEFFYWISRHKPERVLYPSSSAAYPINKQTIRTEARKIYKENFNLHCVHCKNNHVDNIGGNGSCNMVCAGW